MALLRLIIAGAALGLAACGQADAEPNSASATSGLDSPPGWRALPELGEAFGTAATAQAVTLDGTDAWGETSVGCYGVWVKVHGPGATSDEVIRGIEQSRLVVKDVVKPELGKDGLVTLTFERPPYRGRLRVRVAGGSITALACFASDREPGACDPPCTKLLEGLP